MAVNEGSATAAIAVSTSKTIKAIAVKSGMTDSAVASSEYTITPAAYTLTVTAPTFDAVTAGYAQPDAQAITITSTGNSNATISSVALSGTNAGSFTLTNGTASVTAGGTNSSYTIRPNAGLAVGTYTATITVTYDGNETATADVSFTVNEATPYAVTITAGANMTKTSGDESQTVTAGSAITSVVYTVDDGYYFPTTYSVAAVNGISVTRDSYTQITVSGTPTAAVSITLTAATAKTKPTAHTTPSATDCTTAGNNDGTITGITADMEYKKSDAAGWTAGTGSVITGLSNGTYYVRFKATDTTLASDNQELTIAAYTASGQVAAPTFDPVGGTFTSAQSVTISCATSGATIYYTTDGTAPTTSSTEYTSAISVSTTTTIKAIAVKSGMTNSSVASATYTITPAETVATPTFSPVGGEYTEAQNVTISCTTSGATIYYTTNGTTPTTSSSIYSSAIAISATTTIKAIAVKAGMTTSSVASATYTINTPATVATPTFSPAGGTYTSAQSVTISCATSGATIYYTTDGTTPTTISSVYSSAISVSTTTTIKAIAVKAGMTTSSVASATYTINTPATVATPTFSPAGGTYTSAQSVTISCATSGATIYYTTDGTTPTTSSSVYGSAISVSTTTTIKAIAVKAGMTNSAVASATYTISSIHVHSYTSVVTTEPTCTTTGLRTYTCSGCGDSYTEVIPALGHNYTSAVTTEPTCTTTGVRTYTCSRCGDSYTEVIPLAAHKYTTVRENEVAPDCIHAGSYDEVEKCSVCGNVKSRTTKTVPALGHDFVNGKCTRCGAVEMTTGDLPSIIENNEEETVILALEADTDVSTLKFPKNVKEIIIDGCGHTLDFTSTASIKPSQKLTLVNITIKAEKNGKKQNITLTAAAGGLVLENVTFDGKKTTITATKGDLTLDNVTANNLTVKGAAKRTLTVEGNVNAATISGFGNIKADGSLTVTKTLKVNTLDLSENAVLNVVKGAAITLCKGIPAMELSILQAASRR